MEEKTIEQEELGALTEQVELATQELGKIESKKTLIKDIRKDVTEHIFNAFGNAKLDLGTKEVKLLKTVFNKVLKSRTEKTVEDEEGREKVGFLAKKIEDMVLLIYAFKYLGFNELDDHFKKYGITINTIDLEAMLPYLKGNDMHATLNDLISEAENILTDANDSQQKIENNIYDSIPEQLKYNKESNPAGINKTTFKKFSLLNLINKIAPKKAKAKCEKLEEETDAKNRANTFAISYLLSLITGEEK